LPGRWSWSSATLRKARAHKIALAARTNPQAVRAQAMRRAKRSRLPGRNPGTRRARCLGMRKPAHQDSIFIPTLYVLECTAIFCGFIATLVLFMLR
jgi:hypothetical protein